MNTIMYTQVDAMRKELPPGALMLIQVNECYEAFDKDAEVVSSIAGVPVTCIEGVSRAGFPVRDLDKYFNNFLLTLVFYSIY